MSYIKNFELIEGLLSKSQIDQFHVGAAMHQHVSRIEFKILEVKSDEITVRVTQGQSPAENQLSSKELSSLGKEFFKYGLPEMKVHIRPIPFFTPKVNEVNPHWIQEKMKSKNLTQKEIAEETGIELGRLKSWLSGKEPMSPEVKAMFYYMLR